MSAVDGIEIAAKEPSKVHVVHNHPGVLFVDWVRKVEAGNLAAEACLEADDIAGARAALGAIPHGDELSSESLNGFAEVVTTEGTQSVADFKARSITALLKTAELYRIVRTKR